MVLFAFYQHRHKSYLIFSVHLKVSMRQLRSVLGESLSPALALAHLWGDLQDILSQLLLLPSVEG